MTTIVGTAIASLPASLVVGAAVQGVVAQTAPLRVTSHDPVDQRESPLADHGDLRSLVPGDHVIEAISARRDTARARISVADR
jgi:hypothetical protein